LRRSGVLDKPRGRGGRRVLAYLGALCISGLAFLLMAVLLLFKPVPTPLAFVAAAVAASIAAVGCGMVLPGMGWRAGLWASAAFLAYFVVVLCAYALMGRPDWHPVLAAVVVTTVACMIAALVDRRLARRPVMKDEKMVR
jgi:peptidoglycan/LPS O-acetylase OafA/YrhL